jgi:cell division septal protein FtsQ
VRPAAQSQLPLRTGGRVSPVRVRRRRTRIIGSCLVVSFLASGAFAASYVSYLPQYSVRSVDVQGSQIVPADLIADYAESLIYNGSHAFFSRADILLYPKALIEKDIPLEFPRIRSATVSRASLLSNTITISVVERKPFALWCAGNGNCYDMDQNGFVYAQDSVNASTSENVTFSGGIATTSLADPIGQTFAPGHTLGLIAFLQQLSQSGFTPLGAEVQSDQDFSVPLSQGFAVYASFGEDAGTLVNNLQLVLSSDAIAGQAQNLEYVDLRFGDKVYYKLKGQNESTTSTQ